MDNSDAVGCLVVMGILGLIGVVGWAAIDAFGTLHGSGITAAVVLIAATNTFRG